MTLIQRTSLLLCLWLSSHLSLFATQSSQLSKVEQIQEAKALIKRIIPTHAQYFSVELIDKSSEKDLYEIESQKDKIILRGNNGVSIASALNRYLKDYPKCQLSWNGDQLKLPKTLPVVPEKIRVENIHKHRVYFNYCTLNYTASWWGWERWQREIDFMAMNGINMPLGVVGLEGAWYHTLLKTGFSDQEAREFLVGPTYFAWQWMTNIQGDEGALPKEWIDKRIKLGRRILDRKRALGMTPIQQGFTGYVPRLLKQKYPNANIVQESTWLGFKGTAQLDPLDPLFKKFGKTFLETQIELFGTSHVYAADPFHEGHPPRPGKDYLRKVGTAINELITSVDPKANIAMQSWSIRKEICIAFPKDRLVVLDLAGRRNKFWGYKFVKGQLHNFGGRINMHGDLHYVAANPFAHAVKNNEHCVGMGLFPESLEQNPVFYNMVFDMVWRDQAVKTMDWLKAYAERRYGYKSTKAEAAWQLLLDGPYRRGTNGVEFSSIIAARPALVPKKSGPNYGFRIPYDPYSLVKAWRLLLEDYDLLKDSEAYQFDVADIGRQVLSNLGQELHKDVEIAFKAKNRSAFKKSSQSFLKVLMATDKLLEPVPTHSFQKWIHDARSHSQDPATQAYYEEKASTLLTLWGPCNDHIEIFDYSWREWSGLIRLYYLPRWQKFYTHLEKILEEGKTYKDPSKQTFGRESFRANDFYSKLADWELAWIKKRHRFPNPSKITPASIALKIEKKYRSKLDHVYSTKYKEKRQALLQRIEAKKYKEFGHVIHTWSPKTINTKWQEQSIDITQKISSSGTYQITFKYSEGLHRLDINSVTLLVNGEAISIDKHHGFTGGQDNKNSYFIKLKDYAFNTKYELKIKIRSDGGNNSNGHIFIKKL